MGWKETYATDPKRAIVGYAIQLALGAFCLMRPSLVERLVDIGLNHDHPGSDTRSTTAEAETN